MTTATIEATGVKFQEAIDYLKGKVPAPTLAWDDLAGPVHSKIFAVSGAVQADLLRDIHEALQQGLTAGTTIADFRKAFDKAVADHGWTYRGKRGWRTRVIFDNNMRSARMAGRWAQIQAVKDRRPFLQYRTAGDARVRPMHRAWDGLVYEVDHSFWDTHFPPNGWGCRCTIRSLTQDDLTERGLQPATRTPTGQSRVVTNADGEPTDIVPVGIDPGWDHNVGKSWITPEVALGEKLARLPVWMRGPMSQKAVIPQFQQVIEANFKRFQTRLKADVMPATKAVPGGYKVTVPKPVPRGNTQVLGYLDGLTLDRIASRLPQLELQTTVLLHTDRNQAHIEGLHKAAGSPLQVWPADFIDRLPSLLASYRAIFWDVQADALVVVPQESFNQTVPTAVFKQRKTRNGLAWELRSLGSKEAQNLGDPKKYLPLVGRLS